jgi:hypothetical protein
VDSSVELNLQLENAGAFGLATGVLVFVRKRDSAVVSQSGNEAGAMLLIRRIPNDNDLIDCHKASFVLSIPQMKNTGFDLDYLSPQAGRPTTVDVDLSAYHL